MAEHQGALAHHFEDLEQQHETAALGTWAFLASELMFFGGLFTAYALYRAQQPAAFAAASNELDVALGTFNTAVLIVSSLTMALGVHAAQTGKSRATAGWIFATIALAAVFLGVKLVEYSHKLDHHLFPGAHFAWRGTELADGELFFCLYFAMTGVHAAHMLVGIAILAFVARRALRGAYSPANANGVEMTGLYWHFVDLVWIFLFPLLYLLGRHVHP